MKKEEMLIFCDGASKGNPGPGGWGVVIVWDDKVLELGGRDEHTTNNKMELVSAINALVNISDVLGKVNIYTDSRYVINGITKWIKNWKSRGWKTLQKEDVLNQDLWKKLDELVFEHKEKIIWHYIGGHIGIAGNERVDSIASDFADDKKPILFSGKKADYKINVSDVSYDETKKRNVNNSKKRSGMKAYSYVSEVGGDIKIHKTWAECEKRVKGVKARYQKALSEIEEKEIVSRFRSNK